MEFGQPFKSGKYPSEFPSPCRHDLVMKKKKRIQNVFVCDVCLEACLPACRITGCCWDRLATNAGICVFICRCVWVGGKCEWVGGQPPYAPGEALLADFESELGGGALGVLHTAGLPAVAALDRILLLCLRDVGLI
jgi:hypothetical protein